MKKRLTTKYTKNTERKELLPFVLFVPLVVDFSSFLFYRSRLVPLPLRNSALPPRNSAVSLPLLSSTIQGLSGNGRT
ncbi:hypothetical protein ACYULU_12225, partial [Breznakiellaceae bacterium SP9]